MSLVRGDIVWHDFAGARGDTIAKSRPALVIQNDIANRLATHTILAVIRADPQKSLPIHVPVPKGVAGLKKDSVVDCGILATTAQSGLGRPFGRLPAQYMAQVEQALKRSLNLCRSFPTFLLIFASSAT